MQAMYKGSFSYRTLTPKDLPAVTQMVMEHYLTQAPHISIFRVQPSDVEDMYKGRMENFVQENASAGCFHSVSGELVGLLLNSVLAPNRQTNIPAGKSVKNSRAAEALINFWSFMETDLFRTLNTKRIFRKEIAVTHPKYATLGILRELDIYTNRLAAHHGCEYCVAEILSSYPQKAALKQGYKILREVNYSDYVDEKTGRKPDLKLSPDHVKAQLVYMKTSHCYKSAL